jgi:outer membrane protein assembly factor BamA
MPLPALRQSSGNRFGFGLDITKKTMGFGKPDFSSKYRFYGIYYPKLKANTLSFDYWYRHIYKNYDFRVSQIFSTFFDKYPYFYGFGSQTERFQEFDNNEVFRLDFLTSRTKIGLENSFLKKSIANAYLNYEYNNVYPNSSENSILIPDSKIIGLGKNHLLSFDLEFNLDFRDDQLFPKNGSLLSFKNNTFFQLTQEKSISNRSELAIAQYFTYRLVTDITLSARAGGIFTSGDGPFYHRSILGSNSYLRGYTRNRFVDNHAIFYNLEAKMHVLTWHTLFAPLRIGVFGFYDNGKVWGKSSYDANIWNDAYGIGIYISPVKDSYNINFYAARSNDKGIYFNYDIGWRF